jgi:hypothetical protein
MAAKVSRETGTGELSRLTQDETVVGYGYSEDMLAQAASYEVSFFLLALVVNPPYQKQRYLMGADISEEAHRPACEF